MAAQESLPADYQFELLEFLGDGVLSKVSNCVTNIFSCVFLFVSIATIFRGIESRDKASFTPALSLCTLYPPTNVLLFNPPFSYPAPSPPLSHLLGIHSQGYCKHRRSILTLRAVSRDACAHLHALQVHDHSTKNISHKRIGKFARCTPHRFQITVP